jgi:hypothetical protein
MRLLDRTQMSTEVVFIRVAMELLLTEEEV